MTPARIAALTIAALVGFAANSLLCRAAIGAGEIDPATFTAIRLLSGAVVLAVLARVMRASPASSPSASSSSSASSASSPSNPSTSPIRGRSSWISALALFGYAAAFSFAYVKLTTATGALLLFAFVQLTMIGAGIARGERPRAIEWLGHATAIAGLVALALPGLSAPDPVGAVLMATAGIAWGVYSLRGRGATNPLAITADNFARTAPMALALVAIALGAHELGGDIGRGALGTDAIGTRSVDAVFGAGGAMATTRGIVLAATSGALASGVGYSIWYAALPHLPATRAAVVQLTVPAIAAAAGVVVLGENLTVRFVICAAAILGGVALAIVARRRA